MPFASCSRVRPTLDARTRVESSSSASRSRRRSSSASTSAAPSPLAVSSLYSSQILEFHVVDDR